MYTSRAKKLSSPRRMLMLVLDEPMSTSAAMRPPASVASRRFANLAEARRHVAANISPRRFDPQPLVEWEERSRRYAEIESRFAKG